MKCVENRRRKTSTVVVFSVAFHVKPQTSKVKYFSLPLDMDVDIYPNMKRFGDKP